MTTLKTCVGVAALLLSATIAAAAESPASVSARLQQSRRDLIGASIAAPPQQAAAKSAPVSADLERAIEKMAGIRLEAKPLTPPGAAAAHPGQQASAAGTTQAVVMRPRQAAAVPTLEELKRLSPDQVENPLGLADMLYQGGHLPEAFPFYEKALAAAKDAPTQAWALFQMANCKHATDAEATLALYRRLAAEHPKSPWTPVGTARQRLLEWRQLVTPEAAPRDTGSLPVPIKTTGKMPVSPSRSTAAPANTAAPARAAAASTPGGQS